MPAWLIVYAGFTLGAAGAICLIRPFGRVRTRKRALLLLMCGVLVAGTGLSLPAPLMRAHNPASALDEFIPDYQFNEVHTIDVRAPREQVMLAIRNVTAEEVALFRTLTWIR